MELNGEKMTYATENAAKIKEISLSESCVSVPSDVTVQALDYAKSGRKALRFETIMLPIKMTTITAYKVFFLISSVKPSSISVSFSSRSSIVSLAARFCINISFIGAFGSCDYRDLSPIL